MLKSVFLSILGCAFLQFTAFCQEMDTDAKRSGLKKNAVYLTGGSVLAYGAAEGNYERLLGESARGFLSSYWVRAGYGVWYNWEDSGNLFVIGLSALTGRKKSHAEFNIGFTTKYDPDSYDIGVNNAQLSGEQLPSKSEYRENQMAGSIGYRFQKPGGHFIFRTGIGYPESLYISLGFCF